MPMIRRALCFIRRFRSAQDGVAVVEFVLSLPFMILVFAIVIECGRLFLGYQSALSGVRTASRYLARVAPVDICVTGGSLGGYDAMLKTMIEKDRDGNSVMPSKFVVTRVEATYVCQAGSYRISPAPIATVAAQITAEVPFGNMFSLFGAPMGTLVTTVSDSSRIFGQ